MPPLPSTIRDETSNLIEALTKHERDLNDFQIPRLRNYRGSMAIQQQYAAELRENLHQFSRCVEELESLVEAEERGQDRRVAAHQMQHFAQSLERIKKDARTALLTSKRAIDSLTQSNLHELLRLKALSEKEGLENSGDALMNASNDVTEALRRTIGLMQGELERSVLSSQMLEQSSASLRSSTVAHDTLSTLLSTSKHLITALEKSDWLDRLLILSAVAVFFLVVLFILKQRVLNKGLEVAFWWTRFFPRSHGDVSPLDMERGDVATLIATATANTLPTAISFGIATTAKQLSSSGLITDEPLSISLDSDVTTRGTDGIEITLQALFQPTTSVQTSPPPENREPGLASIRNQEL